MSNKLKITLFGLFLVQIGIFLWARATKKEEQFSEIEMVIQTYLDNPNEDKMLSLSNMKINKLPSLILECQSLESLDLSHNNFEKIPSVVFQLPNLKYLNLTYNQLKQVRFEENSSIKYLDLGFNNIQNIENQNALKELSSLVLEQNQMDYCPNFDHDIYSLNLSNNQIESFNSFSNSTSKINYLDISNNLFSDTQLGDLPSRCKSLDLSNNFNYGMNFPNELLTNGSTIKNLYLNNCGIKELKDVPDNWLKILELNNNPLIISNLNSFKALTTFQFTGATLKNLNYFNPDLKELDLRNIRIDGSLDLNLPNLEILHVSNRKFNGLPYFPKVKIIYIYLMSEDEATDTEALELKYPNTIIDHIINY